MERLARRVDYLQKSMEIIDSGNEHDQQRCFELMERISKGRQQIEEVHYLLRECEIYIEEQKDLFKELQYLEKKLVYIHENFPEGIVTNVSNEEKEEEIIDSVQIGRELPKNLFNVPYKENNHAGKNTNQVKNSCYGQAKSNVNVSSRNVLSDKLNISSKDASNVPSTPKNEGPKIQISQDISINHITCEEFNQLSSYMRGRITLNSINEFIDKYNDTLNKKYELLKKPKKAKSAKEQEQCLVWKEQEAGELIGVLCYSFF